MKIPGIFRRQERTAAQGKKDKLPNVEYNKSLWDKYAERWSKREFEIEAGIMDKKDMDNYLQYLGDEWGDKESLQTVLDDFFFPFIDAGMCCAEIGSGGGRVASKTIPRISQLVCFDLSEKMLNKAKDSLKEFTNVSFILTDGKSFPVQFSEKFDFVYSFDVFVHLDLHAIWNYFKEIKKILKKGGRVCLHTTNLKAPKGWDRFNKQKFYSVEGHYFITPDIIKLFAEKAGYKIIKTSQVDTSNFYYSRDFLFLMELM